MNVLRSALCTAGLALAAGCASQSTATLPPQSGFGTESATLRFATNLIADGSFETPKVPSGSYTTYGKGQKFSGWSVVGKPGNIAVVSDKFVYGGYTFPAACGHQLVDLTGTSDSRTGLQQSIKTTTGATYTLTFDVGNAYGSGNIGTSSTVLAYVAGKQVLRAKNTKGKGLTHMVWQAFSTTFQATSSQTGVKLINGDPVSDTVNGLDCVTVTLKT
jgi:hypothetical protein